MSNTLGIPETTMEGLADADNEIQIGRVSWDEVRTVRAVDHDDDQGGTDDPDTFALFVQKSVGAPWVKSPSLNRIAFDKSMGTPAECPTNATYVVPDYDYSEFE